MQAFFVAHGDPIGSLMRQILFAVAATAGLLLLWVLLPLVALPLALPGAFLGLVVAAKRPALICLGFLTLTYFKVNEITPTLEPLGYVLSAGSALTSFALVWHVLIARSVQPRFTPPQALVTVLWVLVTVGVLTAQDHSLAYKVWSDFSKVLLLALAITWFVRTGQHVRSLARLFMIGGIAVSLSCIYNAWQGIALVEDTRAVAGSGGLSNPNDLALLLLLPLSFAVSMLVRKAGRLDRTLAIVGIVIIGAAVVLTQSRGGLLGLMAVFTVVGSRLVKSRVTLVIAGLLLAAGLYAAMGISDRVSGGAEDVKGESAQGRLYAWQAATKMAASYPLTGVGIGNFVDQFPVYTPVQLERPLTAHSIWFLVLGEVGLPGLITFVVLILTCAITGTRSMRRLDEGMGSPDLRAIALATVAGLAGFCVSGSFLSYVYQWPLYVLVALTVALARLSVSGTTAVADGYSTSQSDNALQPVADKPLPKAWRGPIPSQSMNIDNRR